MSDPNQKKLEEDEFLLRQQNIGWVSKVQVKKKTAYLGMSRLVFIGSCLSQGQELYSYLAEDELGRKIVVTYLDGAPKDKQACIEKMRYNTFLQESTKKWKVQKVKEQMWKKE